MKIKTALISLTVLISLTALFFSCASTPSESVPMVEETSIPEDPVIYDSTEETVSSEDYDEVQESVATAITEESEDFTPVLEPVAEEEGIFIAEDNPDEQQDNTAKQEPPLPEIEIEDVPLITDADTEHIASTTVNEAVPVQNIQETAKPSSPANSTQNKSSKTSDTKAKSAEAPETLAPSEKNNTAEENLQAETEDNTQISEVSETAEETEIEEEIKKEIIPSREVSIKNNQYLDIVYPGTGWVYLGETDGSTKMRYFGRKLGSSDTSFSLRSREEGSTILHFYKNDALTGEYIDDYLSVTIKGRATDQSHAKAPSYAEAVPSVPKREEGVKHFAETKEQNTQVTEKSTQKAAQPANKSIPENSQSSSESRQTVHTNQPTEGSTAIKNTGTQKTEQQKPVQNQARTEESSQKQNSATGTKTNITEKDTSSLSSDEILNLAQDAYKKGKYSECLAYLNDFFEKTATRMDEGLFLQGQTLESNSSVRNIKKALETYETIVRDYPQSINWEKANERVTYLKRFYFNIR